MCEACGKTVLKMWLLAGTVVASRAQLAGGAGLNEKPERQKRVFGCGRPLCVTAWEGVTASREDLNVFGPTNARIHWMHLRRLCLCSAILNVLVTNGRVY